MLFSSFGSNGQNVRLQPNADLLASDFLRHPPSARFGECRRAAFPPDGRQLWAEHVYHLDLVMVALRLAHPRPRAVWRCTIDGPLCGGLAGGAREAALRQEARLRLRVSLL